MNRGKSNLGSWGFLGGVFSLLTVVNFKEISGGKIELENF